MLPRFPDSCAQKPKMQGPKTSLSWKIIQNIPGHRYLNSGKVLSEDGFPEGALRRVLYDGV